MTWYIHGRYCLYELGINDDGDDSYGDYDIGDDSYGDYDIDEDDGNGDDCDCGHLRVPIV